MHRMYENGRNMFAFSRIRAGTFTINGLFFFEDPALIYFLTNYCCLHLISFDIYCLNPSFIIVSKTLDQEYQSEIGSLISIHPTFGWLGPGSVLYRSRISVLRPYCHCLLSAKGKYLWTYADPKTQKLSERLKDGVFRYRIN